MTGQVDDAAGISGGCLCCLPDAGGLDDALERLAHPRLRLDVILVEASGVADPAALARVIRFSGVERVRPGGLIDVIDAVEHFRTIDIRPEPPARYGAATLVVIGKSDLLPAPNERRPCSASQSAFASAIRMRSSPSPGRAASIRRSSSMPLVRTIPMTSCRSPRSCARRPSGLITGARASTLTTNTRTLRAWLWPAPSIRPR